MISTEKRQKCLLETYSFSLDAQSRENYESIYGQKTLELAHILRCIESELSRKEIRPHILFQLIRCFFSAVESQDPLPIHQDLARKVLKKEFKNKEIDTFLIDLLSREICIFFNKIGQKIFPIPWMSETQEGIEKAVKKHHANDPILNIIEIDNPNADKNCFNKQKIFKPLKTYLTFLESTGKKGKEHADKIRKRNLRADSNFWFKLEDRGKEDHFFHSPAFLGLTRIIWEDIVKKRIDFNEKYPPCAPKPTFQALTSLMTAKKDDKSFPEKINLVNGPDVIGTIDIPLVPSNLHPKVFQGVGKINTVVGHKALRYVVSLPYKQKLMGVADFRVREFEGGFVELGKEIGLKNKRHLAELREIFYTLKHLDILNIKDSRIAKGKLIDLTHYRSSKTGREDGLAVTVLPTLVSYGEIDCSGMLLIPMATLSPPVKDIAPTQYHASLYYLQMCLLEEFSEKSKEFYQHECIHISGKDWDRLLAKADIPIKYKQHILEGWSVDGDAPKVIECIEKDHYILGKSYEKPSKFLKNQGKIRIQKSRKGKASAQKRKMRKS